MTSSSPPPPELRSATARDARAVAEIWHAGWRDGHLESATPELVATRDAKSFRNRAAQRVADTTVAVVEGEVAGFVMVVGDEVEQVYVDARHRGRGVADALMVEAERRVGHAGYAGAWLAVVEGNARARRFYERHGWHNRGTFDYAAAGDAGEVAVPALRYVKEIAPGGATAPDSPA